MTLPLPYPYVVEGDNLDAQGVQGNFEKLSQVFPLDGSNIGNSIPRLTSSTTARKINFGIGAVTFTASNFSAAATVTHGLGVVPALVLVVGIGPAEANFVVGAGATSTSFNTTACWITGVYTGSVSFYWLAIG